jgi:hypothetical protein
MADETVKMNQDADADIKYEGFTPSIGVNYQIFYPDKNDMDDLFYGIYEGFNSEHSFHCFKKVHCPVLRASVTHLYLSPSELSNIFNMSNIVEVSSEEINKIIVHYIRTHRY